MGGRGSISCEICGVSVDKMGNLQRYCPPCSEARHAERRAVYAKQPRAQRPGPSNSFSLIPFAREAGRETSSSLAERIFVDLARPLRGSWKVRVKVPYDQAASKNYIFGLARGGHVPKRKQKQAFRELLTKRIRDTVANAPVGAPIFKNKIWIEIFVQKPDHKRDAINLISTICDAVKDAIGIDDRWFSIARLDWQIVKHDPQIIIGLFQEEEEAGQACSYCGRVLPLSRFCRNSSARTGYSRICNDCDNTSRRLLNASRALRVRALT